MLKVFPIDFIRQIFTQVLLIEKNKNNALFGGDNEINIFSFYEHLQSDAEVDRYVETFRDLTEQQNRTGLIGNGVLTAPTNPSITNLNQGLIIPLEYTLQIRTTMANRDTMLGTLYNLIERLKGRKVDIAQLDTGKLFMVGTIGVNTGFPSVKCGDYIGEKPYDENTTLHSWVDDKLGEYDDMGLEFEITPDNAWLYYGKVSSTGTTKICVVKWNTSTEQWEEIEDSGEYPGIIFPPEHTDFEKYQVSISFESVRCDEPRTLNSEEYCNVSFGGSATIVSHGITLGNELVKLLVKKYKVVGNPDIELWENSTVYVLDPLELPSGNNVNTTVNQLISNEFKSNSHADAINLTIQYNFIVDKNIALLKQWFMYARYGIIGLDDDSVCPNLIYQIGEVWSNWGNVEIITYLGKIIENIEIENTESDVLSLGVSFQVQGENN